MNIEKTIEFDKVKLQLASFAVTSFAKDKVLKMVPLLSESQLRKNLRETNESKELIEKCGMPPLSNMEELKGILLLAEQGGCLTESQLENVEMSLVAMRRLKEYLNKGRLYDIPIAYYDENIQVPEEVGEMILQQIRNGQVDDHATKELFNMRSQMIRAENKMKERADSIIRANKEYMSDSFSTFRNGKLCIPVKKEYRMKLQGIVQDKSSTGSTLFIEPASVAKLDEGLQLLKMDEVNEVYRILYTLSAMVADAAELLTLNIHMIEKLDYIFAKGKLSIDMEAVEPTINTDRVIDMQDARHPLMQKNICVPIQFSIGGPMRGIVITGPNTGGKTVAIKTVALNCMMAQCGLHVTCSQANVCMNSNFLCDIGDGQNLSENLSTFSAHIQSVLSILEHMNRESLVIMDELGSGTDPTEGMGIAMAILEELKKSECLFLVTTHYPEIKQYAERTEGISNARMEFDKETLRPLYRMTIGESGESCAFYVASRLGMSNEMLETAIKASYGEMSSEMAEMLKLNSTLNIVSMKPYMKIQKINKHNKTNVLYEEFHMGDSVMIYPEQKIGIVCQPINEKGDLRVQLPSGKIWINHKKVKLQVPASQLYPENYDFSIIFDTKEQRKKRHQMARKYTEDELQYDE